MNNIQSVSIISAFPIGIIMILMIWSFIKDATSYLAELKRKNKEKELEIQRLKKENARLREERDILKKWFFIIFCGFKKRFWELKGI